MGPAERALRLVLFFIPFVAYVAFTGLKVLAVRLAALVSRPLAARMIRRMTVRWNCVVSWWARVAAGISVAVEGAAPEGTGLIIVANHQSLLDIPVLVSTLPATSPLFVSKEQMRWGIPNISPAARYGGFAFISRRRGDGNQFAEIERLGARLEPEGVSAVIFPEGTRSRDGTLGVFKAGGLGALLRSAPVARVLPVAIDGTWRAASFRSLFTDFLGMKIRIRIGPPIEVEPAARSDAEAAKALAERCKEFCAVAQAEWKGALEPIFNLQ